MGKMESPNLLSLEGESKQIKDVFTDRFDWCGSLLACY